MTEQTQKELGKTLWTIADQIAGQSEKLNALKTQKKALMQQLFPLAEEAT